MLNETEKLQLLVSSFNRLFAASENTVLKTGAEEPFYQAWQDGQEAVIYSRDNYFSSALHEIAHWCIAGKERRKLDDFGYWYQPEGRSQQQQLEFERVEVRPQAVEWALSLACDHQFHYSADNLSQGIDASNSFKQKVHSQMKSYLNQQLLPNRANLLFTELLQVFRQGQPVEVPSV